MTVDFELEDIPGHQENGELTGEENVMPALKPVIIFKRGTRSGPQVKWEMEG